MAAPTVTLIPGDGIGPEVMEAAVRVVAAAGIDINWETHHVGRPALDAGASSPLPDEVVASIQRNRLALKGPVSTDVGRRGFRSVNVELRRRLDLFAQSRRCHTWSGVRSAVPEMDIVVIRETTEDLYAGAEAGPDTAEAKAIIDVLAGAGVVVAGGAGLSIKWTTAAATRRAVEYAFAFARLHGRSRVTVAHKATVMRHTDGIFLEVAREVASAHADIEFDECQIDSLCARLVTAGSDFDVLVMPNMYGDIVSDLGAALTGGVGLVPGANVGDEVTVFEAAHGSAPRHAGRRTVNPTAAMLCGALLVRALGRDAEAAAIEGAIAAVIAEGATVTYDIKRSPDTPPASTDQFTDAVISRLG